MTMEESYLNLLREILENGVEKEDRTAIGTKSLFGASMRFSLRESFPLITTKKVHFKAIVHELLWFISGQTNIQSLQESGVRIWNEWADENGDLGPVYGKQWRDWETKQGNHIDQLQDVISRIKETPHSRRLIVNAWNVGELSQMALPPCHLLYQFYVANGELSCQLYQRSADMFLGVPFNIASYALLTLMVAQVVGLKPGDFVHTLGDAHIYSNHMEQVTLQLSRTPYPFPTLRLNPEKRNIDSFVYEDITLENYQHHPLLKGKVAV